MLLAVHLLEPACRQALGPVNKSLLSRLQESLAREGLWATISRVALYPVNHVRNKRLQRQALSLRSNEDRFTWIYRNNHWGNPESLSGAGSTLKYTENLRRELPGLFRQFGVERVFDAPCGDFNWMGHLLATVKVRYTGGDIVRPLVEELNRKHAGSGVSFVHFDLTKDIPPEADLMICRDCLFHLSYEDTKSVLLNFVQSGIPYLLTTTHRNEGGVFVNTNIASGDFRRMDLFSAPYRFPQDPLARIDDWLAPDPERQMCLWSRDQVAQAVRAFGT